VIFTWQDAALALAGFIGGAVAVIHGIIVQRNMVVPIGQLLTDKGIVGAIKRLVPGLLHFSTFNWFLSGLALIAVGLGFVQDARLAICLLVGSSYLYGALGNLWATRGRHVGWVLYAVALVLIAFGATSW
jgi:hypothetical protein